MTKKYYNGLIKQTITHAHTLTGAGRVTLVAALLGHHVAIDALLYHGALHLSDRLLARPGLPVNAEADVTPIRLKLPSSGKDGKMYECTNY